MSIPYFIITVVAIVLFFVYIVIPMVLHWSTITDKSPKPIKWWYHKFLLEFWWGVFRSDAMYYKHLNKMLDFGFNIYGEPWPFKKEIVPECELCASASEGLMGSHSVYECNGPKGCGGVLYFVNNTKEVCPTAEIAFDRMAKEITKKM